MSQKIKEIEEKVEEIKNEIKKVEKIDNCLDYDLFFDEDIKEIVKREENIISLRKELIRLARKNSIPYFEIKNSCQKDQGCLECIEKEEKSMKLNLPALLDQIDEERTLYFLPDAKVVSRRNHFTARGEKKVIRFTLRDKEIEYHDYINYKSKERELWGHFKIK